MFWGNWGGYIGPSSAAVVISVPAIVCAQEAADRPNVPVPSEQGLFQDIASLEEKRILSQNGISLEEMCQLVLLNIHQKEFKEAEEFYQKAKAMQEGNNPLLVVTEARLFHSRFQSDWERKRIDERTARDKLDDMISKLQEIFFQKDYSVEVRRQAHYLAGLFHLKLNGIKRSSESHRVAYANLVKASELGHPLAHAELISGKLGLFIACGLQKKNVKDSNLSEERKKEKIEQLVKKMQHIAEIEAPELYKKGIECALQQDDKVDKIWSHLALNLRYAFFNLQIGNYAQDNQTSNKLYTHARLMIEEVLKIAPNNERGHNYLGAVYLRFANINDDVDKKLFFAERSLKSFRRALEINPHDSALYCNLIKVLSYKAEHTETSNGMEEARPVYQEMLEWCHKLINMEETHRMTERDLGYAEKCLDWGRKKLDNE
ncbi:hypothetical protein GF371_04260 [Candidatus Woesearchaeota archaeon]|nr:hypothetical protein [Candidatus Woesearchaeota archaeon]